MPLGKLTKRQIESAYAVLGEAQKVSYPPSDKDRTDDSVFAEFC